MSNIKSQILQWEEAEDVKKQAHQILKVLDLPHIKSSRIHFFRTNGSKSRSYARIWTMPKIFQRVLSIEPVYVIEVLSKYFDRLNPDEQKKVLIHEFLHIPKNFSGALIPHKGRNRNLGKMANLLFEQYKRDKLLK